VIENTPISLIFLTPTGTSLSLLGSVSFSSVTASTERPLITRRLKAAEPTMVDGPSSPGQSPKVLTVSRTASKISGALDPKAMRDKLATVAFQTKKVLVETTIPFLSLISTVLVYDVIFSIPAMNISAMIEIPKNSQHNVMKYATARTPTGRS